MIKKIIALLIIIATSMQATWYDSLLESYSNSPINLSSAIKNPWIQSAIAGTACFAIGAKLSTNPLKHYFKKTYPTKTLDQKNSQSTLQDVALIETTHQLTTEEDKIQEKISDLNDKERILFQILKSQNTALLYGAVEKITHWKIIEDYVWIQQCTVRENNNND